MLKKRMLTVLAVLLSCAFLFTGCKQNVGTPEDNAVPEEGENADETEEDGTFVFGFTGIDMENPYFITLEKAIREVIEENEYQLVTKDPASDPETQAAQIQEMIDEDNYDISQIEPNLAAYYTVDDQLYSMPFNSSTPLMYYNKDIFEKAGITEIPTSLEGIEAIGDKLLNEGGAGEVMSLSIYGWFFEQFLGKQGLDYANNGNGREAAATAVAFDENGGAANILNAWKSLNDKGYAPVVGKGGDAGLADFSAGKSAITLASTASLKQILQDVNGKFEVGTAYFPSVKDSDQGGVSIGGASLWALNNQDPKKLRATWEFVKFLVSPESQAYWNAQTGYFPVTTAAQEEQVFKDNIAQYPQFQTAIDQLHDSSPEYVGALLSVFSEARATVESEIESMLNGEVTADEAVAGMADSINKSIEEYNLVNE